MPARRQHHEFLAIDGHVVESIGRRARRIGRLRDERRIDFEIAHAVDQIARYARDEFERHFRPAPVIFGECARQAARGGTFHRAKPQPPARTVLRDGVARLVGEGEQAFGVRQQCFARGRQDEPAAIAREKLRAELLFELPDARRHVRLHAIELRRGARHTVFPHDRPEDIQRREIHLNLPLRCIESRLFIFQDGSVKVGSFASSSVESTCPPPCRFVCLPAVPPAMPRSAARSCLLSRSASGALPSRRSCR
jgi:hypothetical protein